MQKDIQVIRKNIETVKDFADVTILLVNKKLNELFDTSEENATICNVLGEIDLKTRQILVCCNAIEMLTNTLESITDE